MRVAVVVAPNADILVYIIEEFGIRIFSLGQILEQGDSFGGVKGYLYSQDGTCESRRQLKV